MELRTTELFALTVTVGILSAVGMGMYHKQESNTVSVVYETPKPNNCTAAEWLKSETGCVEDNSRLDFSKPKIKAINI